MCTTHQHHSITNAMLGINPFPTIELGNSVHQKEMQNTKMKRIQWKENQTLKK